MYLGLDIGSRAADYALTADGQTFTHGRITLEKFPDFAAKHGVRLMACEYTGRLAERWCLAAEEAAIKSYIMHSVERRAITVMSGQSVKTDKRDAETLAAMLYVWADKSRRGLLRLTDHLFTEASTIRTAWQLRSILASVDRLTELRTAAKLRVTAANRTGNFHMADIWEETASGDAPERALQAATAYARETFPTEFANLLTIPGIGDRMATFLLAHLLPIERFEEERNGHDLTLRNLKRYAGLYPKVQQSGDMTQREYLSRRGSPSLRGMLFVCAMRQTTCQTSPGEYYKRRVEGGMKKKKAIIAVSIKLLSYALTVLRSGKPFTDHAAPVIPPKPELPAHLVPQMEAAQRLGISRQAVSQQVKSGRLRAEQWPDDGGKWYVVLKYLEIEIARREEAKAAKPRS